MQTNTDNENTVGCVYILTNPAFKGLVKIGKTSRPVEERVAELNNTAVPTNYDVYATFKTSKYGAVERAIHMALNRYRYSKRKEFFSVTPEFAYDVLNSYKMLETGYLNVRTPKPDARKKPKTPCARDKAGLVLYELKSTDASAEGVFDAKTGRITVKAGAVISATGKKSGVTCGAEKLYGELKSKGVIADGVLTVDYEFRTLSRASCLITRSSVSGVKLWRRKNEPSAS